jgi:hypothetical protein
VRFFFCSATHHPTRYGVQCMAMLTMQCLLCGDAVLTMQCTRRRYLCGGQNHPGSCRTSASAKAPSIHRFRSIKEAYAGWNHRGKIIQPLLLRRPVRHSGARYVVEPDYVVPLYYVLPLQTLYTPNLRTGTEDCCPCFSRSSLTPYAAKQSSSSRSHS